MKISQHDLDIMTRTIIGEARGESFAGKVAVAHVILNRWKRPGWWSRNRDEIPDDTIAAVCLDPSQFSCWNAGDPNLRFIGTIPPTADIYLECLYAALAALTGHEPDPTDRSCHYYTDGIPVPDWAVGRTSVARIGAHVFFNDVG